MTTKKYSMKLNFNDEYARKLTKKLVEKKVLQTLRNVKDNPDIFGIDLFGTQNGKKIGIEVQCSIYHKFSKGSRNYIFLRKFKWADVPNRFIHFELFEADNFNKFYMYNIRDMTGLREARLNLCKDGLIDGNLRPYTLKIRDNVTPKMIDDCVRFGNCADFEWFDLYKREKLMGKDKRAKIKKIYYGNDYELCFDLDNRWNKTLRKKCIIERKNGNTFVRDLIDDDNENGEETRLNCKKEFESAALVKMLSNYLAKYQESKKNKFKCW